jgi:hypothetical protein
MPYISVHVSTTELFEDVSDNELLKEVSRRKIGVSGEATIPAREARQSLIDSSDFLRKCGRVDLAHRLDEIKTDYLP